MVELTLCTHLHNYARAFGVLSILFWNFLKHFLFELFAMCAWSGAGFSLRGYNLCMDKNPQAEARAT